MLHIGKVPGYFDRGKQKGNTMIFGAILAGGTGQRMKNDSLPKQFLELCGKPIIIHTLEKFWTCTRFDAVYLGIHKDWIDYMLDLIRRFLPDQKDQVIVVCGGEDRNSTLFNVIDRVEKDHGVSEEHIIVTHDAVRPFVTLRMIEENIDAAVKYGAADTVIPAVDTIICSNDGKTIASVLDRRQLYQVQTPQSFQISLLKNLYGTLSEEERGLLTDACSICTVRNQPVHLVEGSDTNIKITTPGDLKVAQAMMEAGA